MNDAAQQLRDAFDTIRGDAALSENARRTQYLRTAKAYRDDTLARLRERHYAGAPGCAIVEGITASVDVLLHALYDLALAERGGTLDTPPPCALVALGGYGRGALFPASDLDVMVVYERRRTKLVENINNFLLYFLWDVGFKVGHSLRSVTEAVRFAQVDDTSKTAMLESRLIAGNSATFERYQRSILRQVQAKGLEKFITQKQRERERVFRELGTDVFADEPHLKQSPGGLRDYQTGLWIAIAKFDIRTVRGLWQEGLISEEDFLQLDLALDFLYRVRNHLHFEAGMQDDHLTLERQEQLAQAFAYEATDAAEAVELFMQDYYQNAMRLHQFYVYMLALGRRRTSRLRSVMTRLTTQQVDRGLMIAGQRLMLPEHEDAWFREDPARLFEVVWYAQKYGLEFSDRARARLGDNAHLIDEEFRRSPLARNYFLALLNTPERAGASLRFLDALGMLERYLPEFGEVRGLVRFQAFHQFPVEEHLLRAVENLAVIGQLQDRTAHALKHLLETVPRPDLLALGIFLHDIGKIDEADHVDAGIAAAERMAERMALPPEDTAILTFLIRQHLLMSKLSQYRDLDDEKVIQDFAAEVGTMEHLNLLYLLTFCDVNAVRDGLWTEWKSALLLQLYRRTQSVLVGDTAAATPAAGREAKRRAVCDLLGEANGALVNRHLQSMRPAYFREFAPEEIAEHITLARRLDRTNGLAFHVEDKPHLGCSVMTIVTTDRPRLFTTVVGGLASLRISILAADVFTRDDGTVFDMFRVMNPRGDGPLGPDLWDTVRRRLRQVLQGERDVRELLAQTQANGQARHDSLAATRLSVSFDNQVSDTYTVIDLEAGDRIGLLFDVSSRLADLDLDLALARINTDVRQARDAFYVRTRAGTKLVQPDELERVRRALLDAAAGDHAERKT